MPSVYIRLAAPAIFNYISKSLIVIVRQRRKNLGSIKRKKYQKREESVGVGMLKAIFDEMDEMVRSLDHCINPWIIE
jgi:hypothetical protein